MATATKKAAPLTERPDYLRERLKALPETPGVYLMRDVQARVIYVGKALSLRNRVPNYFQASSVLPEHIAAMVARVYEFEVITTANEKEALVLEQTMIKRHRPRFNIRLRDDKNYLYIKLPLNEDFPRITLVRHPGSDGARYWGPYTHAIALRTTLKTVRRVIPYRSCKDSEFALGRPCFYFHLNLCSAPCAGFISRDDYHDQLNQVASFLDGRSDVVAKRLKHQMQEAADKLEYEAAARYRDRLDAMERMAERQKVLAMGRYDQDLFGLARAEGQGSVRVFAVREGRLSGSENFDLVGLDKDQSNADVINAFISQYYANATHIPKEVFVSEALPDRELIEQWLSDRRGSNVTLRVPQRGKQRELLEQAAANAAETMRQMRIRLDYDAERTASLLNDLQARLMLPALPVRIECYDISNIQGKYPVGSMVVFEEGRPKPPHYRHFRIKTVQGANDFAMLQEVLRRRFSRHARSEEGTPEEPSFSRLPDLVLIDGGKGQLSAAREVMEAMGLASIATFGLAKEQEELFRPGDSEPIRLPLDSEALFLVQRVRDEAHRFAITFHRVVRKKDAFASALDGISGLGPVRRRALVRHFGSIDNIRSASLEALMAVKGISRPVAVAIKEML
ncbi:MAG: excinuclease ABC subunit UvrC [Candidatus Dormibacteraeota bacterium]|nr:excinuclease ABC subunit UvrC [Candidatus Dormibacteraeota bacterium]